MTFPDDSVQGINGSGLWKEVGAKASVGVGTLIRATLPYVAQVPAALLPAGRPESSSHDRALFRIAAFGSGGRAPEGARQLPVAALPGRGGEVYLVFRAKIRPAVVVAASGKEVDPALRRGHPNSHTSPSLLVAPYFGVEQNDNKRAGYSPELVQRIRRGEYPQFFWDVLPIKGEPEGSVLRLDQLQPLGLHHASFEQTGWALNQTGMEVLEEWSKFHFTGKIPKDGVIELLQASFPEDR